MNNLQANLCLLAVTLCWSCEVVIFSVIPSGISPFATTCITSLIGAVLLAACFAKRIADALRRDRWLLVRRIALLSVLNTTYNVLYLVGLDYFDVSTGAFTISMTVVVLPVLLLVMRRGVSLRTWISAGCVLAGIAAATASTITVSQQPGIIAMLIGCLVRALFIVKLNDYARKHDPVTLACGMSGMNAAIAFLPWCAMQPTTFLALPWTTELIAAYVIYSYFIVGFATVLNIFAQRRASAAQSTIIYSTEIVFSTIWATCLPASIVDPVELSLPIVVGCLLIVAGNLVEIVPVGSRSEGAACSDEAASSGEAADGGRAGREDVPVSATGFVSELFGRLKTPVARRVVAFAILLAVYLVIALPFKELSVIPGFTDIRPISMLQPIYGIFFGVPGCFAFAVGNLIGDIASDSLRWSSIAGFVGNFAYPYLMYLFWRKLRREPFNLRRGRTIALMAATMVVCACIQAAIITPAVALFYPDVDATVFFATVVGNSIAFPLGFTIPCIILLQEELGFQPLIH